MKKGYWIIRTYEAGRVGEKTKFFVPDEKGRSRRREAAAVRKQEQNEANATRRVARLLNENFGHSDYLAGLDFSDAGMERVKKGAQRLKEKSDREDLTEEDYIRLAAAHEGELFLRRLKNRLPEGAQLKYLLFTSDRGKDKRGELVPVRVHMHVVISGIYDLERMRQKLISAWGLGGVYISHLYEQADYWDLAVYLMEQVRRIPDAKAYKPSRNLVLKKPKDRVVYSDAELRVPRGAALLRRGEHKAGEPQYLRYLLGDVP